MKQLFSRPMCFCSAFFFALPVSLLHRRGSRWRVKISFSSILFEVFEWSRKQNQLTVSEDVYRNLSLSHLPYVVLLNASLCRGSVIQTSTFTGLISDDRWTSTQTFDILRTFLHEVQTGDRIRPSASSSSLWHMLVDAGGNQVIVLPCCLTPAGSYLLPQISSNTCVFVALCNVKQRRMKSWTLAALRLCPNLVNKHWEAIL